MPTILGHSDVEKLGDLVSYYLRRHAENAEYAYRFGMDALDLLGKEDITINDFDEALADLHDCVAAAQDSGVDRKIVQEIRNIAYNLAGELRE